MTLRALACLAVLAAPAGQVALAVDGWASASRDYRLRLPEDHASHPAYRIEWWYYTGHLRAGGGRRFGYQVTFFRIGVDPSPANPSVFAVRDLWMAHAAVTDVARGRHLSAERLNRAGAGWAGASSSHLRVWNDDWQAWRQDGRHHLRARDPRFGIELAAAEQGAPVLHGEAGYSQKGAAEGNASHYYSLTRMATTGHLAIGGERFAVTGTSWMDHEFGTSFLEPQTQGWDWLSVQLSDGSDLMLFQLRGSDGRAGAHSSGTVARAGRAPVRLGAGAFSMTPGRTWRSPGSGARYPVEWTIEIPQERLRVNVSPAVDAQEVTGTRSGVSYWEGLIDVAGTRDGRPVGGSGYLEMTGYAGRALGELISPP